MVSGQASFICERRMLTGQQLFNGGACMPAKSKGKKKPNSRVLFGFFRQF